MKYCATAVVVAATLALAIAPTNAQDYPVEYPALRYVEWDHLSIETQNIARDLGYDRALWNVPGSANIEELDWIGMTSAQRDAAIMLGFDIDRWDCFQNHYIYRSWNSLAGDQQDAYTTLGWNEQSWSLEIDPPAADSLPWMQLSDAQRRAALSLCYNENTWNELDLTEWTFTHVFGFNSIRYVPWDELNENIRVNARDHLNYDRSTWNNIGTASVEDKAWSALSTQEQNAAHDIGFNEETWNCYQNHYLYHTWTGMPSNVQIHYVELGWTSESWNGDIDPPAMDDFEWHQLTTEQQYAARQLCYTEDTWDLVDLRDWSINTPLKRPSFRYVPWAMLQSDLQNYAVNNLDYTPQLWNHVNQAQVENTTWADLNDEQRLGAEELGFDRDSWDCFQINYYDYGWEQLGHLQATFAVLGWNEDSWNGVTDAPPEDSFTWEQLTGIQRKAALAICLQEYTWNQVSLQAYYAENRFIPWKNLAPSVRTLVRDRLQYTAETWNVPGTAAIENSRWGALPPDAKNAARTLGFETPKQWDCFQNHFFQYSWADLNVEHVQEYFVALGWTADKWGPNASLDPPDTDNKSWMELTNAQQTAAFGICYNEYTWNLVHLEEWKRLDLTTSPFYTPLDTSGSGGNGDGSSDSSSDSNDMARTIMWSLLVMLVVVSLGVLIYNRRKPMTYTVATPTDIEDEGGYKDEDIRSFKDNPDIRPDNTLAREGLL